MPAAYDMPKTSSAPPNFYSTMAQAGKSSSSPQTLAQTGNPSADSEFLQMVEQAITVIDKLGKMPPAKAKGEVASKYIQGAMDALKQFMAVVQNKSPEDKQATAGSGDEGSAGGTTPPAQPPGA